MMSREKKEKTPVTPQPLEISLDETDELLKRLDEKKLEKEGPTLAVQKKRRAMERMASQLM